MKQRPILFNGSMVRAILSGQKTQTRRAVKPHRSDDAFCLQDFNDGNGWWPYRSEDGESPFMDGNEYPLSCPFGSVGDQLWVRETWMPDAPRDGTWADVEFYGCKDAPLSCIPEHYRKPEHCIFNASWTGAPLVGWTPSIHMPRWASRITLEITSIRVERLQDISEEDALSEGANPVDCDHVRRTCEEIGCYGNTAKAAFRGIWEATGGDWQANPWVWVIEFKRVEQ